MALETNVLRYLANCLERRRGHAEGTVTLTSPTQPEEKWLGFDAMTGLPNGRYVLLQFKRPEFCGGRMSFRIPSRQVSILMELEAGSSFFVLPVVWTNKEMWDAKTALLDCTFVVDARDLCAPFVISAPSGSYWPDDDSAFSRAVHVDTGDGTCAVTVSQGSGRKGIPLPARPISRLCDPRDIGFVVENGIVGPRPGRGRDRKRFESTVEWRPDDDRLRAGTGTDTGGRYVIRIGDYDRRPRRQPPPLQTQHGRRTASPAAC